MDYFDIHEDLIKITQYDVKGKLPDPFLCNDGTRLTDPKDWEKRRKEIFESAVTLQYGHMPPEPEFLEVEPIYVSKKGRPNSYRIITGRRDHPVSFVMVLFKTDREEKCPVVVSGDLCFPYAFDKEYLNTFLDNGINFCTFNRCELAPDVAASSLKNIGEQNGEYELTSEVFEVIKTKNCGGALKACYPEYDFGATAAWAWGYSRVVDALEILGNVDLDMIAFTGHSRGGKTALLAGAVDTRAAIVNPNAPCMGGGSCYRLRIKAITEDGEEKPSEPLENICRVFPAWMGPEMDRYVDREEELPFDTHYLLSLVAPRVLFSSEAASDIWSNPVGIWQSNQAAREVYKFLGCEENHIWYYRKGYHFQRLEDIGQLVNVIKHKQLGEPLNDHFFKTPFKPMEPIFDWKCP